MILMIEKSEHATQHISYEFEYKYKFFILIEK